LPQYSYSNIGNVAQDKMLTGFEILLALFFGVCKKYFLYLCNKNKIMSYKFNATVSRTGYIPIPFMHDLFNKQVEVIISPSTKRRTTKERLTEFFEQSTIAGSSSEISWGKPVGKEVW
jgi:hypothetical protein